MRLPKDRPEEIEMDLILITFNINMDYGINDMPAQFQFINNETNEVVTLNEIDKICCEKFNETYSTTNFSNTYQVLTWVAYSMAAKSPNDQITEESFEAYRKADPDAVNDWDFMKRLVLTDYSYSAWYSRT